MRHYFNVTIAALLAFVGVTFVSVGAAHAADAPDASVIDLAAPVIKALTSGNPALACALALVLAVALARKYAPKKWRERFDTDIGGTALTFFASLGAAAAAALTGGALPTFGLLWTATQIAAGASGGYTMVRRLAAPLLRWIESKMPAAVRPFVKGVFDVVLYFFEKRPAAITKAEADGAAAVKAKPAPGVAGVVGKIRDLE